MKLTNNNTWYALGDRAIVREMGKQLKQMRLNQNITQQQLATTSGLDRVTVSKLENGRAATLLTFVQVLRALNKLELLETFKEEPELSPLQVAEMQASYRKRASSKKQTSKQQTPESEW